jgi:TorA maturation chaperone TorD
MTLEGQQVHTANGVPAASGDIPATAAPQLDAGTAVAALDLLSHWWSRPVAEEVKTWVGAAGLEAEVRACLPVSAAPRLLAPEDDEGAALLDEHERLFVGPGPVPCPPYESYWREDVPLDVRRSLMGPCTAELRQLYADLGLEMTRELGELPDHIAVELEALTYALSAEATYPQARAIFCDHLRRWLPRLCRAVGHETTSTFYRDLAEVTLEWSATLQRHIESLASDSPATG